MGGRAWVEELRELRRTLCRRLGTTTPTREAVRDLLRRHGSEYDLPRTFDLDDRGEYYQRIVKDREANHLNRVLHDQMHGRGSKVKGDQGASRAGQEGHPADGTEDPPPRAGGPKGPKGGAGAPRTLPKPFKIQPRASQDASMTRC